MVHSSFYYAKEGGSQFIVNRLKQGLNIKVGAHIQDIEKQGDQLIIEGEVFDKLVYCGDIRKLPGY